LLLREGYRVIVRPHPETVKRSSRLLKHLAAKFKDNPAFTLEWSVATNDSLLRADVLISECSGVALEYALGTERPVLFLDTPIKVKNDKYEELCIEPLELSLRLKIGVVVPLDRLSTIPAVIDKLILDSAQYKEKLAALRTQCVYNFGHAVEVGAKYIDKIMRTDC
jgi:YidC/Oxa1 family membrane protein insertase